MGHVLATLNADRRPLHHRGLDYAIATFFGVCYFGLIALRRTYPVDAHTIVRRYEAAGHTRQIAGRRRRLWEDRRGGAEVGARALHAEGVRRALPRRRREGEAEEEGEVDRHARIPATAKTSRIVTLLDGRLPCSLSTTAWRAII